MARIGRLGFILSAASFLMSAQNTPPLEPPAQLQDSPHYTLGPDDQVKIWALGIEEIADKPVRIGPSGDLDLPLIGKVHALGLTVEQLKTELVQRFSKEVLKPQVSIEIVDFGSQPVSVMGAVNHPGVHQLRGGKTLMEVVSMADGLRSDAGPHQHQPAHSIRADPATDCQGPIQPEDSVWLTFQ
jgi:protein involved in polysaccharide export with SLBB domain